MHTALPPVDEQPLEAPRLSSPHINRQTGGVFASPEARAAMMAMYDTKLARWPVSHEEFDVATRYGRTHVVAAGSPKAPPLIMLHMCACPSFIWAPIIARLAARCRTYAVDTIGDISKSVLDDPRRYPKTGDALAAWLGDVSDSLGVETSDVLAGSYGGWLAMHYATAAPGRVRRLALLVPMGLPTWTQTMRVLFKLGTILIGQSRSKTDSMLSWMMGDDPAVPELAGDWMSELIAWKCKARLASPLPVPAWRLASIRMPTLVVLGGRDRLIGNANRAALRAQKYIRNVEIEIVPSGTHAVHAEEAAHVAARVLAFLER